MNIICWLKGHDPYYDDDCGHRCMRCKRCGDDSYEAMACHAPLAYRLRIFFFRLIKPFSKCSDCGRRFRCDESVDHLPF